MSSNYYSSSQQEQEARRAAWEQAPKECPYCRERNIHTPINQHFSEYGNDKPRRHCGSDKCRKAASRAGIAKRKREERKQGRARVLGYCQQRLDPSQRNTVMNMCDMLMQYSYEEGHQIAEQVVQVIEAVRCKHDRISVLLDNASAAKRRADEADHYNRELQAVYQHRIAELQSELSVYQLLEGAIHNIATRQLAQQPDPQERPALEPEATEPEDEDRRAVLATLAAAGIKPIDQALAEQGEGEEYEDDDTENDEGGEEDEGE